MGNIKNKKTILVIGAILLLLLLIMSRSGNRSNRVKEVAQKATQTLTGGGDFDFDRNTPGYENFSELVRGCSSRDCIPSIDDPTFESVDLADSWLEETDVVFVLEYKGEVRAYPQRIMNWHEIVNDVISDDPIAVTFCPLCGSALAFDRRLDGQILELGVSGFLHNNDLVMYDRQTSTLWQQITGEAIVGEHFGKNLTQIPMSGMRWIDIKKEFSSAQVLSQDTGFSRDYNSYPYGDYEQSSQVNFPNEGGVDNTIHPKTVVYGVEIDGKFKAYQEERIKNQELRIKDKIAGVDVEVDYNSGDVTVVRLDTNDEIPATRLFWFAWKTFHPDTELY